MTHEPECRPLHPDYPPAHECPTCLSIRAAYLRGVEDERKKYEPVIEALSWYADPEFYHAVGFWFDPPCGGFDEDFSSDHGNEFYKRDMPGKLARKTLDDLYRSEGSDDAH